MLMPGSDADGTNWTTRSLSRTDRQDAMNLIAHSTNVKLTLEPGVGNLPTLRSDCLVQI